MNLYRPTESLQSQSQSQSPTPLDIPAPETSPIDTGVSPISADEEANFIATYVFSPEQFARDIFNIKYDPWQTRAADKLLSEHFVTVRSGNGVGKTYFESTIIFWFLTTRHMAQIPCTANSAMQLKNVLWSNLSRLRFQSEYIQKRTRVTEDMIQVVGYEKAWFAVARTAQNAKGEVIEALQGFHGDYVLFVVDEASGVPDKALDSLESAATGEDSYGLMCSNATRRQGLFFRSWHKDRDLWGQVHVKPEDTTRVSGAFRARMRRKYGGEETNGYRIRVLGEFPKQSDMGLLSEEHYDHPDVQIRGHGAELESLPGDVTFSCDPAGDAAESDSATIGIRVGNAIYDISDNRSMDLKTIGDQILGRAMEIAQARRGQGMWNQKTIPCYIDVIGIGLGLAQYLERLRRESIEVLKRVQQFGNISAELIRSLTEVERELLVYIFDGDFILNPLRVAVGGAASKPIKAEDEEDFDPTFDELPPELTGASGKDVYHNLRAQLFCYVADEITFQRIQICRELEMLREDLTALQKSYMTNNKIKIQSKREFRAQNDGRSTDYGDAAVLLFVEDVGKAIDTFEHNPDAALAAFGVNLNHGTAAATVYSPLAHKPDRMAQFHGGDAVDAGGQKDSHENDSIAGALSSFGGSSFPPEAHRAVGGKGQLLTARGMGTTIDQKMSRPGTTIGRKKFKSSFGYYVAKSPQYDF